MHFDFLVIYTVMQSDRNSSKTDTWAHNLWTTRLDKFWTQNKIFLDTNTDKKFSELKKDHYFWFRSYSLSKIVNSPIFFYCIALYEDSSKMLFCNHYTNESLK